MEKSDTQKRVGSKKTKILILLMFLGLISPKAWSYAEKELPPSFSENTFSSGDTLSSNETFSFSRAVLTDEKGVALCQVNLIENPQFLPQFTEPGSSEGLEPLDLPECEEESLDIVAQYAEQAWVKKEVALIPFVVLGTFGISCFSGFLMGSVGLGNEGLALAIISGGLWGIIAGPILSELTSSGFKLRTIMSAAGISALTGGLVCYGMGNLMFYE